MVGYMLIAYYFLDLAVHNACLLYRRERADLVRQHKSLLHFKIDIFRFLIVSRLVNSSRADRPFVSAPTKRKTKLQKQACRQNQCAMTLLVIYPTHSKKDAANTKNMQGVQLAECSALNVRFCCV